MILHSFANEPEVIKLFEETKTFAEFKNKLEELAISLPQTKPIFYNLKKDMPDNVKKIKGDMFELFCELLVSCIGSHSHIGLGQYRPVNLSDDEGVDAYAVNTLLEKSAVQCKFVSNPNYEFTANDSNLPNFLIEARFNGIPWEEDTKTKRLFLITSAKGIHYHTISKWRNCVFIINGDTISTLTDNNLLFWSDCLGKLIQHQKE
ncbi:MAG: hypothetical protein WC523_03905 [Patescibacteria group bacterium]